MNIRFFVRRVLGSMISITVLSGGLVAGGCASAPPRMAMVQMECRPVTCGVLGATCSVFPDGCGGVVNCGACDRDAYVLASEK
jgi:hypothetical protein